MEAVCTCETSEVSQDYTAPHPIYAILRDYNRSWPASRVHFRMNSDELGSAEYQIIQALPVLTSVRATSVTGILPAELSGLQQCDYTLYRS
jgi:hypothetical protein